MANNISYLATFFAHDARKVPGFLPLKGATEDYSVHVLEYFTYLGQDVGTFDCTKPRDAAFSIVVEEFENTIANDPVQNPFPMHGNRFFHRLADILGQEQSLSPNDFQLLSVYLIRYGNIALDVLAALPVKNVQSRRSTSFRPMNLSMCDKLIASLLLTLNVPQSISQSSLVHAVSCLAHLVARHSDMDSILGVQSNVLQMTRLCLSRAIYPNEEDPVWDAALGRQGLICLMRISSVAGIDTVQDDIRTFCTKWISRLVAATDTLGSSAPQIGSAAATHKVNMVIFPQGDLPPSPATARWALSVLHSLANLCLEEMKPSTTRSSTSADVACTPGSSLEWLRRHFLYDLKSPAGTRGEASRVEGLMRYIGCACPFASYKALQLAEALYKLDAVGNLAAEVASALEGPCQSLLAAGSNFNLNACPPAVTALLQPLLSKTREVLKCVASPYPSRAPCVHDFSQACARPRTVIDAIQRMDQSSDDESVEVPLCPAPEQNSTPSQSQQVSHARRDTCGSTPFERGGDVATSDLQESLATLSLTSASPVALAASQLTTAESEPSATEKIAADSTKAAAASKRIPSSTQAIADPALPAWFITKHAQLQANFLQVERKNLELCLDTAAHLAALEEKNQMLKTSWETIQNQAQRLEQALRSAASAQSWAADMQERFEQQQRNVILTEMRLAEALAQNAATAVDKQEVIMLRAMREENEHLFAKQQAALEQALCNNDKLAAELAAEKCLRQQAQAVQHDAQQELSEMKIRCRTAQDQATAAQRDLEKHRELIGYINKISRHDDPTNKENCALANSNDCGSSGTRLK